MAAMDVGRSGWHRAAGPNLTDEDWALLDLLRAGRTDQQIADELHLSVGGVCWRKGRVFVKLGATNRTEAAVMADRLRRGG